MFNAGAGSETTIFPPIFDSGVTRKNDAAA
jgi:hypothetical protein